jgi:hypothetical protein
MWVASNDRHLSVKLSLSKLAKMICLIIFYVFSSTKLENKRGVGGEVAQTMYTYVSKCNNDKRRKKKKLPLGIPIPFISASLLYIKFNKHAAALGPLLGIPFSPYLGLLVFSLLLFLSFIFSPMHL